MPFWRKLPSLLICLLAPNAMPDAFHCRIVDSKVCNHHSLPKHVHASTSCGALRALTTLRITTDQLGLSYQQCQQLSGFILQVSSTVKPMAHLAT